MDLVKRIVAEFKSIIAYPDFTFSFRSHALLILALAGAVATMSSEEEIVKGEEVAPDAEAAPEEGAAEAGPAVAPGGGAGPAVAPFEGGLGFKVPSLPNSPAG